MVGWNNLASFKVLNPQIVEDKALSQIWYENSFSR